MMKQDIALTKLANNLRCQLLNVFFGNPNPRKAIDSNHTTEKFISDYPYRHERAQGLPVKITVVGVSDDIAASQPNNHKCMIFSTGHLAPWIDIL